MSVKLLFVTTIVVLLTLAVVQYVIIRRMEK